jgi:hypothetical protein
MTQVLTNDHLLQLVTPKNGTQRTERITPDVYRSRMQYLTKRKGELLDLLSTHWEFLHAVLTPVISNKNLENKTRGIELLSYVRQNCEERSNNAVYSYLVELYSVMGNIIMFEEMLANNVEYEEVSYE